MRVLFHFVSGIKALLVCCKAVVLAWTADSGFASATMPGCWMCAGCAVTHALDMS